MSIRANLVDIDVLQEQLEDPSLHIFDVRWYIDGRSGIEAYQHLHLRTAKYLDLEKNLVDFHNQDPRQGRHPLPSPGIFTAGLSELGISTSDRLVFYDDQGCSVAARAWWMASALGYDASLLNGGLNSVPPHLLTKGGELVKRRGKASQNSPSETKDWDSALVIDEDELKRKLVNNSVILLDARSADRYHGLNEQLDPRAGHIPQAQNLFWKLNVTKDHKFRPRSEIAENFRSIGISTGLEKDVVSSCGSGITACHNIFALLYSLEILARLFPPSFSGWCANGSNRID